MFKKTVLLKKKKKMIYLLVLQASEKVRLVLAVPMNRTGARVLVQTRQLATVRPGHVAALPCRVQPLYLRICRTKTNAIFV